MAGHEPALLPAFVGRQPIFDSRQRVLGYELLFRVDDDSVGTGIEGDRRTAEVVMNTFVEIGLDQVVGPHLAYINATRTFLLDGFARDLPPDRVVVEVLEDVTPDDAVVTELRALKAAGFRIALDDFEADGLTAPLLDCADIVKLDTHAMDRSTLTACVGALRGKKLLVAERLETQQAFEDARALGFDHFQGFFLARPVLVARQRPPSNRLAALRVLALLGGENVSFDALEDAISCDVTLAMKVLRVINSAAFGLRVRVESLKQGLVLLGQHRVHTWVALAVLAGFDHKPAELLTTALVRARMCERLGEASGADRPHAYFTAGLFSTIDAMLDARMVDLLATLPLTDEVNAALIDRVGPMGRALATTVAYEQCDWDAVMAAGARFQPDVLRRAYLDGLAWASTMLAVQAAA